MHLRLWALPSASISTAIPVLPALVLFTECLEIRFAVRIEEFLGALLPRRSEFGQRDVPVWPTFLAYDTQVLAEIFQSGSTEEPIAVVHLINDKAGLKHNHEGDRRIVGRIGVLRDIEIFLDDTPRVGEERPVGADSAAVFIRLADIVGADGDKPAIGNLEVTMELNLKLFFCTFALGDIHHHTHNPLQLALLVELSSTAPLHPNGRSVRMNLIEYLPSASLCRPTNIAATLKNA